MKSNKLTIYLGLAIIAIAGFFLFKILYLDKNAAIADESAVPTMQVLKKKINIQDFDLSVFQNEKFLKLKERPTPDLEVQRIGKKEIFKNDSE